MKFPKPENVKSPWVKNYGEMREHLDYPEGSLYNYMRTANLDRLDLVAYTYYGTEATYRTFLNQIDKMARALRAYGIHEDDTVTICMPNTPEAIITFYALNKIGAIANMIHPLSAENEIHYYFNISESRLVLAINVAIDKVVRAADDTPIEKIIAVSPADSMPLSMKLGYQATQGRNIKIPKDKRILRYADFLKLESKTKNYNANRKSEDPAAILYSGGTTGYPKGIVISNFAFNAVALEGFEASQVLSEGTRVLAIMPIFHGFGLGVCIHTVFTFGGISILLPQFNVKTFDKLLTQHKPNVIVGVPTLYEALLLNEKIDKMDLSFIKFAISGGDSLSISLKRKLDKFFQDHHANIQIREGYGMTECLTGTCLTPKDTYREGSIGIPYPDNYYKIFRPNTHTECEYGEEGEICIYGPSVMLGYLKDEAETNHTLQLHEDGIVWLHTGDLGLMDEDGFVYYKQRLKRMIVSSGYNVYPQYIENVIDSHPAVLSSTVIGIDHPYKKQVAKAFIVLRPGYEPSEELKDEIYEHCKQNLAKYSLPYQMEFRESLPKTLVGKVAYRELEKEESEKQQKSEENA